MLPTVHKHWLRAATAAFVVLLAAAPAQAAPAPKIKAAYTQDRDRDGHVDGVALKWSTKMRGGRDVKRPFAVKVGGYKVTKVGRARGKRQVVKVAERRQCDTGGSVRVAYRARRGTAKVKPKRGKRKVRAHRVDMRRFDLPVPRITCAVTLDSDGDGYIDGVRVTYSRAVRSRAQRSGRFLFSVAGYRVTAVGRARNRFLRIDVAERAEPDSGARPAIGYSRPSRRKQRRFAVRGGRRTKAFSGTYRATRDGVSPQLLAARTGDADRDGLLDAMALRFSEPVAAADSAGLAVLGMELRPAVSVNGATIGLSLVEGSTRGDARPGTWVSGPGVTDLAGNPVLPGAVAPADGAPPVMLSAVTQDTGGKPGHLDAVSVGFSEPVAHPRDASGAYPFILADREVTSVEPANGGFVQVRMAEASAPDSGEHTSVRYIPGAGLPVADAAGNQAAEGFVNATDGVAPVLLSARTVDSDADGRIDGSLLGFSEPVEHGAEGGGSSFALDGYQVTAAGAANGAEVALTVAERSSADSGARPRVTYTPDGVEDVRDAAGNVTPHSSLAQAADGAPPILLSVRTADADSDGRIDRLATSWSEPLSHADDTTAPFAVAASGFGVARVHAATGQDLTVDLVEPSAHDTGSVPALTYLGGAARIRDASGLEPDKRTWSGLTVDALAPRLVSATTGDADADGQLDSIMLRFSENVVHPLEASAPSSFTASGLTVLSAEAATGDGLELKVQETGVPNSGLRPAVGYTPDGQADVRDASANLAPSGSIAQAADGAHPVLLSAATADVDDDGRLDRVETAWSEPLVHPDDTAAPFPVSAAGFTVTRVHPAVGQTLDIDLAEPSAPDTGSAPDLTYTPGVAQPIRDASGLEAAQTTYAGLTQDALPPRRIASATADTDFDGKLDAVEIEWSEAVTGSTLTAPYTVAGRTLGANVSFDGVRTRIPFDEHPTQHDTADTPAVSYDDAVGDLHDIAKGAGDTAEPAPAVAAETPLDKAAPILVAAKTADLSTPDAGNTPNGTIDAVLTTFSEPIAHAVDGVSPFSLNVAGRAEVSVEGDAGPGDRTLYVSVEEGGAPDGGETPNVAVSGAGPAADHIKDRAAEPNDALVMTFTGTTDEVRPVLMSAQLGERPGAGPCAKDAVAGTDGKIDCVLTTWSEDVTHAGDTDGTYSLASSGWTIDAGGIGPLGPSETLALPLTPDANPDRDRSGTTVSYDGSVDAPVVDTAGAPNEALDGTTNADSACRDTGREPNDVLGDSAAIAALSPAFERKCAFDPDWFAVTPAAGHLEVASRPVAGIDIELAVFAGDGSSVTADTTEAGGAGEVDRLVFSGLGGGPYHVRVTADDSTTPQEGPYCLVYSNDPDEQASCGPLAGQIVFTEVGLGSDKFIEIKNDAEVPVEMRGASAELRIGPTGDQRTCTLTLPPGDASILDPDEHVLIETTATAENFGCAEVPSLGPEAERLEMFANGAIDTVPFDSSVISTAVASEHSLEFVESTLDEDHQANDLIATRWCRTFAAHTKGAAGDGCDEYRINEVLWRPTSTSATSDGRAFVEVAGNIPTLADSKLLAGWVLRGVNGLTGDGTSDFVLPADASPRTNGTYVIADGVSGATQVNPADVVWDFLDLNSALWPDGTGVPGPRGLQLLTPDPPNSPPCTNSADAFGWTTTAQGFSIPLDDLRSCPGLEGQEYTNSTVGASAARDNLSNSADTTYNENRDTGNNRSDFCPQTTPDPGQLNIRPSC